MGSRHEHDWSQTRHLEGSADGPSADRIRARRAGRPCRYCADTDRILVLMPIGESVRSKSDVTGFTGECQSDMPHKRQILKPASPGWRRSMNFSTSALRYSSSGFCSPNISNDAAREGVILVEIRFGGEWVKWSELMPRFRGPSGTS